MAGIIILLLVIALVAIVGIGYYNKLVRLRNEVDEGWSQIDVQLNRRADLIPNLVNAVKGYASHEQATFAAVTEARSALQEASTPAEAASADAGLSGALGRLFAVSEAYPELQASTNFVQLQEELTTTENRVANARQFYNDKVRVINTAVESFPDAIFAGMAKATRREYFEVVDETVRAVPKVEF